MSDDNIKLIDDLLEKIASRSNQSSPKSSLGSYASSKSRTSNTSSRSSSSSDNEKYMSPIEQKILRSSEPIEINETERITLFGEEGMQIQKNITKVRSRIKFSTYHTFIYLGIWINKQESKKWKGELDISCYQINHDKHPKVIRKQHKQVVKYVQELCVRYLKPPTPPIPGAIIITQEANTKLEPAPPIIIRQVPQRPETPEPLVFREEPPKAPVNTKPKRIVIAGKRLPPPPRKVIIERMASIPAKPQCVIVERWLPYELPRTRRVVFHTKAPQIESEVSKPKNLIIQWSAPHVKIHKEVKYLGVIETDPVKYVERFGASLRPLGKMPEFVNEIETPKSVGPLAAECEQMGIYELEGDFESLKLVNLEAEGLSEYYAQVYSGSLC